jgi:Rrf2 family transcriptional regulator, cysteine metabolism repressor
MMIKRKTQYALRAVLELSKHYGLGPLKISEIARTQAIPPRFLEVILNHLKQSHLVESRRGSDGGYILAKPPQMVTAGEIIRYVNGPLNPVECLSLGAKACSLYGCCAFQPMWEEVNRSMAEVLDMTTFQRLVDQENERNAEGALTYSI